MALFQSYAVIYLAIGVAIHEVLFVFYSYPNENTETATFDRTVLIVSLVPRPHPLFNVTACNIEKWVWPGDEATDSDVC